MQIRTWAWGAVGAILAAASVGLVGLVAWTEITARLQDPTVPAMIPATAQQVCLEGTTTCAPAEEVRAWLKARSGAPLPVPPSPLPNGLPPRPTAPAVQTPAGPLPGG